MTEHLVQTISMSYSTTEDRLEMRCRSGDCAHSLWLSQRLWRRLTPALIKWLIDSGVGSPQAGDFIRQSMSESVAEPVIVPQYEPVKSVVTNMVTADSEPSDVDPAVKWVPETWLCTTANLSMAEQKIRIQLVSERSEHVYILSMSALETGHFLIAQRQALKESEWPFEWPNWLQTESIVQPDESVRFLH
ncbi:MAG: hypothetical protein KC467_05025 [Marinomonas atlantica]|nr:hypothetical protein [Marinomonas atlantica]